MHVPIANVVAAPLLLALWTLRGPLRRSPWPAIIAIVYFGRTCVSTVFANVRVPYQWDYGCFWLYGHLAAAHKNVYDPSVFAQMALPFTPTDEFVAAVLKVGFPYPPPSIALFLPFGYIDSLSVGIAIWYAVQFAALAGAAWLLARTFMPAQGWTAAVFVFGLVLALPATQITVDDAQTNFLLLLVVALALARRTTAAGAMWQMLAVWIKPFSAALFLVDVVRLQWRRLGIAAATAAVSMLAAVALLGPSTVMSYVWSNPAGREPAFTFIEKANQSLLAAVLRSHTSLPAHISALHEPLFLGAALAMLVVSVILCARAPRDSDLSFAVALLLGMLLYPATLTSYGVAVIVPILVLWNHREVVPGSSFGVVAVVALVTLLQGAVHSGFSASLVLWICSAVVLAAQSRVVRRSADTLYVPRSVAEIAI